MINKKEAKIIVKKTQPPKSEPPKYDGKGTRARLNTAAEKMIFNTKYS